MAGHVFTGFGFGPIQSGLFVNEAFQSGNFSRIVVAEVDQTLVDAIRANNGTYYVNVAGNDGIEVLRIDNIEIYNPTISRDKAALVEALAESSEIVTSLPSVGFYTAGGDSSVASLIAEALQNSRAPATIIYTAENNNHAAEILQEKVNETKTASIKHPVQYLNTVIGKMSQVVIGKEQIEQMNLKAMVPAIDRAFLVEEFNRILVTRNLISDFKPGIEVFVEKDDLLPFEEAKLYGHNAIHALLAYLGALKGYANMTELRDDAEIMRVAESAFLNESGVALIKKYSDFSDVLFTEAGFKNYAEDLLGRMTNPFLSDTIERAGRDPVRKLGIDDRIFGTMTLAIQQGIEPVNMAMAAMAAIAALIKNAEQNKLPKTLAFGDWRGMKDMEIEKVIGWLWSLQERGQLHDRLIKYIINAKKRLLQFIVS